MSLWYLEDLFKKMSGSYPLGAPNIEMFPVLTKCPISQVIVSYDSFESQSACKWHIWGMKYCLHVYLKDLCDVLGHALSPKWPVGANMWIPAKKNNYLVFFFAFIASKPNVYGGMKRIYTTLMHLRQMPMKFWGIVSSLSVPFGLQQSSRHIIVRGEGAKN
jgi:hypothetical protein